MTEKNIKCLLSSLDKNVLGYEIIIYGAIILLRNNVTIKVISVITLNKECQIGFTYISHRPTQYIFSINIK